ncbi:MAG: hypothetical protein L0Z50_14115 [Verrucomicrobiales bacterium]|nr:hypothetical protein [Verrucomicrobiales bacterium]
MPQAREIRIALLLLLIFVAGGVAGFFLHAPVVPEENAIRRGSRFSPAEREERLLFELHERLQLSEDQRSRIRQQITNWGKERSQINRRRLEDRLQLFERISTQIRTNLTEQQQRTYDQRVRQVRRTFRRMIERESTEP